MATPNIVNVATINAKNAAAKLTGTSRTEAIDVPADKVAKINTILVCLLYTSPSPRDGLLSRMPSSA